MTAWDDLNARARGLGTHLLGSQVLEGLAQAPDLTAVAAELERRGYVIDESARGSAAGLELAARRAAAAKLRILSRWAEHRTETLVVIFEDEDRRSITALIRGAVQHAPAELRLSGLIPTNELPERALEELARQPSAPAVVALLAVWGHPLGKAAQSAAAGAEPDLLSLETAINVAFVQRALRGARRAGRRGVLYRYVRQLVDIQNAYAALVLSQEKGEPRAAEQWLPGGGGIPLPLFERAVATRDSAAAARLLATGFGTSRLARVFAHPDNHPAGLERAVLGAVIAELGDLTRTDPLSPATVLSYALRLRAEALDVRWLIWGISLGAPSAALLEGLGTAK
jgi:vacuolar-type H+-ATPase subunit C/Vma6